MIGGMAFDARSVRPALLLLAGIAAAAWAWADWIRPNAFPKRFGTVIEGEVYRAGELTPAAMRRVVERHGIRTVVDLGADPPGSRDDLRQARTAAALGVERVRLHLEGDGTGDPNVYVQTLEILADPARQPVLVHCGAGTERTGAAVALHRHIVQGVPLDDGYAEAVRAGHCPRRNPRLKPYLDRWSAEIIEAVRSGGEVRVRPPPAEPPP
jgi:hypothetical protein